MKDEKVALAICVYVVGHWDIPVDVSTDSQR